MTADIEQCHRAELLAGVDPLLFSPKRWQSICKKERDAVTNMEQGAFLHLGPAEEALGFMPFALSCPANKTATEEFGYHIVALLVAVLCEELDPKLSLVGETRLPPKDQPLDSGRNAYVNLNLEDPRVQELS
jgi:hypothetical protein